jgi:hypothetical protein
VDGGRARFAGTVKVITTPAPSRRVLMHDRLTGAVIREVWSDAAGAFQIRNLAPRAYYLVAFDNNGGFDPTVSAVVTPVVAP